MATEQEIKDIGTKAVAEYVQKLKDEAIKVMEFTEIFNKKLSEVFSGIKDLGELGVKSFKDFSYMLEKNESGLRVLGKTIIDVKKVLGIATPDLFPSINKTIDGFSDLNASVKKFGEGLDAVKKITSTMGIRIPDTIEKTISGGAKDAEAAEKMHQVILNMLSDAGNLKTVFGESGKSMEDLSAISISYINSLETIGKATGHTLESTMKYANQFYRIPGVMTENIKVGGTLANTTMSALTVAMKVAAGSGQDFSKVMEIMKIAYENVGNAFGPVNDKAQKGLALFSMMSSLSKELNLQFNETEGLLTGVAQQFKFIGDNTQATANIMLKFTDALRNTGLTSNASLSIIKDMTESLSRLTLGTKAFISARAGGPGGLQGALQIETLMRQGKSDEVMRMVLNTMRQQFGGRIITQQEGAQSQVAAQQFVRQRMMLQSGMFGNLVGTGPGAEEKATRLLEALSKGDVSGAVKTSQDAINEVANQGNELQKSSNTILTDISRTMEKSYLLQQITTLQSLRQLAGSEGLQAEDLRTLMQAATATTTVGKKISGAQEEKRGDVGYLKQESRDTLIKKMETEYVGGMINFAKKLSSVPEEAGKIAKKETGILIEESRRAIEKAHIIKTQENIKRGTPLIAPPVQLQTAPAIQQQIPQLQITQPSPANTATIVAPIAPMKTVRAANAATVRGPVIADNRPQQQLQQQQPPMNVKITVDVTEDAKKIVKINQQSSQLNNNIGSHPLTIDKYNPGY